MDKKQLDAQRVEIYFMGKRYEVPADLTILKALEYVGYRFIRGTGCRGGFCGACGIVYRIKGDYRLKIALACQETVQDGMYFSQLPFTPANKTIYNIEELKPVGSVLLQHYPELSRCLCCNTCTKACPQDLEVMNYVQAALKGNIEEVANLSFDCISCGLCAMRCPAEIGPHNVALLARRLYGAYIMPRSKEIEKMVQDIRRGKFDKALKKFAETSIEALKNLYDEGRREEAD